MFRKLPENTLHETIPVDGDPDFYIELSQVEMDYMPGGIHHERAWVRSELDIVDVQLKYHRDSDLGETRQIATADAWRSYAIALRNRVIGGVVQAGERPVRPT